MIIVGGGIGGLTAALKLNQVGCDVELFEKFDEIRPHITAMRGAGGLGLGINLLPHCTKVLHGLGLQKLLQSSGVMTERLVLATNEGLVVWEEPRGLQAGHETPQYSIHRAALADLLAEALIKRIGSERVHLRHDMTGFVQDENNVCVTFRTDTGEVTYRADAMIAADGIHSKTRKMLGYNEKPRFTGWIAYRGCCKVKPMFGGKTMVIMGKMQDKDGRVLPGPNQADLVAYPMSVQVFEEEGKSLLNWVCEFKVPVDQEPGHEDWSVVGDKKDILDYGFGDWHLGQLKGSDIINDSEKVFKFVVYDRDPIQRWTFGRVTLLGDAAHPMLPFGSQGAGQAILDCEALGEAIWAQPRDMPAAFKAYEEERLEKANAVVLATRKGGDHMPFEELQKNFAGEIVDDVEKVLPRERLQQIRDEYIRTAGYTKEQLANKVK